MHAARCSVRAVPAGSSLLANRWVQISLYMLFWTMLGLFNTGQSLIMRYSYGRPMMVGRLLLIGVADWYVWAALAPLVVYLGRRFPLEQRELARNVVLHLLFSAVCVCVTTAIMFPIMRWADVGREPTASYAVLLTAYAHLYVLIYWSILGVSHAVDFYRKYRDRELRATQLEGQLAQARLQVLKMQLDPHFLFNTLHAVSTLIQRDPDAAEAMLARLGDMLRMTLDTIESPEVTLREELAVIEPYMELQHIRFGDRLTVSMNIAPDAMNAMVPNLILQPIVENAIRYGIEPVSEPGQIDVSAERQGEWLHIRVQDTGPGLPDGELSPEKMGLGISNTLSRLGQLYGIHHRFEIANGSSGGAVVTLGIPWHTPTPR